MTYNSSSGVSPSELINLKHMKIYHKLDLYFKTPKVSIMFYMISVYTRPTDTKTSYYNLYQYNVLKVLFEQKLTDVIDAGNSFEFTNTEK